MYRGDFVAGVDFFDSKAANFSSAAEISRVSTRSDLRAGSDPWRVRVRRPVLREPLNWERNFSRLSPVWGCVRVFQVSE